MKDDRIKVSINENAIELDYISKFVIDRIEAAKIVLEKEILLNHDFEDFEYTSAKITNILRNIKIEYSFIDSDDNDFVKFTNKLTKTLVNDSLFKEQFVKYVKNGMIE